MNKNRSYQNEEEKEASAKETENKQVLHRALMNRK